MTVIAQFAKARAVADWPPLRRLSDVLGTLSPAALFSTLLAMGMVLYQATIFNDPDTFWHIAAGGWMIDHRQVLHKDIFSFSYPGRPWASHEWLAEIVMAGAYRLAGWSGVLLLFAGAIGVAAWLLGRGVARWLGPLGQGVALIAAFLVIGPTVLARPHLLMLPILVAWTLEMLAAREANRAPHGWMAILMVAWANLHGSFVFGFVLAGGFGLEALTAPGADRWKVIRDWGLFGGLIALAALATPHGISGLIAPFQIMLMGTLNQIIEWKPANFTTFTPFEGAILVTLLVCLAKGVRIPLIRVILLLFILHMALQHQRHQLVIAVIAPLLLAQPIGRAFGRAAAQDKPVTVAAKVFLAGFVVAMAIVRLVIPATRGDDAITPVSALAHVPPALAARPVFNAYNFGGYLIFKGVKPFIDGRADMYGDAFVKRYTQANNAEQPALDQVLKQYDIAWTITQPREGIVAALERRPNWKRIYADKYAVVLARTDALGAPVQTLIPAKAGTQTKGR
ncbi:hypothetical protein [Phenylobacterium sp.]|uniref:hypothetical protein n=1 Tax=Phenylobacterium sp. TaxID=1871053 RepID=UPI002DF2B5B8|nr:hypothetical protein [Phenylobacterium sp.]